MGGRGTSSQMVPLECFWAPSAGAEWLILSRSPWPQPQVKPRSRKNEAVKAKKRKKIKPKGQKVVRPSTEKREDARKARQLGRWRAWREVIQVLKKVIVLGSRCEARQKTSQGVTSMVEAGQRGPQGGYAQRLFIWSCHIAPFLPHRSCLSFLCG